MNATTVGVIGCGYWGPNLLRNFAENETAELRWICDAEELNELAERNQRTLMVDHTFVYTGAVRKMKEIVSSGELGQLLYFDSVRINLGLFQPDINVLWDLAPHDLSIMDYLINRSLIHSGLYLRRLKWKSIYSGTTTVTTRRLLSVWTKALGDV